MNNIDTFSDAIEIDSSVTSEDSYISEYELSCIEKDFIRRLQRIETEVAISNLLQRVGVCRIPSLSSNDQILYRLTLAIRQRDMFYFSVQEHIKLQSSSKIKNENAQNVQNEQVDLENESFSLVFEAQSENSLKDDSQLKNNNSEESIFSNQGGIVNLEHQFENLIIEDSCENQQIDQFIIQERTLLQEKMEKERLKRRNERNEQIFRQKRPRYPQQQD